MFEKVNPAHPDKVADRIAGALVDLAYEKEADPRIAVEVLIGHGTCHIIAETSVFISPDEVAAIVSRIAGSLTVDYCEVPQDQHLSDNQKNGIRCGDNGIFKGVPESYGLRHLFLRKNRARERLVGQRPGDRFPVSFVICQREWSAVTKL